MPESNFSLDVNSRLPKFLSLPADAKRGDYLIDVNYYGGPPEETVEFILKNRWFMTLGSAKGEALVGVGANGVENDFRVCPCYVLVRVHGVVELLAHPQGGSKFTISDDRVMRSTLETLFNDRRSENGLNVAH